jgi:hypothetical protein
MILPSQHANIELVLQSWADFGVDSTAASICLREKRGTSWQAAEILLATEKEQCKLVPSLDGEIETLLDLNCLGELS